MSDYKINGPVTLAQEEVLALHRRLREMRHDVNGQLANIVAAAELMRLRPESTPERLKQLLEQPQRIVQTMETFSREFETRMGLRPS